LVVGIRLPTSYPFLQICADIAQPTAIITDTIEADTNNSMYIWSDRSSPRVAKMLEKYKKFDDMGGTGLQHMSWGGGVQLWLRLSILKEAQDPVIGN
jgi:hypothetical protein